jgi:hypothetical protein
MTRRVEACDAVIWADSPQEARDLRELHARLARECSWSDATISRVFPWGKRFGFIVE